MKKYFLMLLSLMFVATMSVVFVSCGDDEEKVPQNDFSSTGGTPNTTSLIYGTWKDYFSTGYIVLQLNSNGTGYHQEYDESDGGWHRKHSFTFSYNEEQKRLYITEGDETEVYEVRTLSSTTLKLFNLTDSDSSKALAVYTRDNDNNGGSTNIEDDETKYDVVGTWQYSDGFEQYILDFKRNGSVAYNVISTVARSHATYHDPIVGTSEWKYNSSTHKWTILSAGYSTIPGNYVLVGSQLILRQEFSDGSSRTKIYNRQ